MAPGDHPGTAGRPCDLRVRRRDPAWRGAYHLASHRHPFGVPSALTEARQPASWESVAFRRPRTQHGAGVGRVGLVSGTAIHTTDNRDLFIAHASEDKDSVARPLLQALKARGWSVWLDEVELTIGDSLSGRIDAALARSRFGVVVLSSAFFAKPWPQPARACRPRRSRDG